ncbi:plasmid mobilization protein [Mucilaginibacter aquaedulcis]|uniref:plasmid mobilization protein n=1 Tax=Mucilaginibacter aquaedulcis TaxID=1187081 RepID=UPI0025B2F6B3|nr:plasmid mobilization relaxosome protein MobC [Mucilaginibacter aquaedulcis]MDN3548794.1 plasmid mobilization relaxosome protein MobC [Mucilaginibacter aquaedulcis]
MEKKDKGRKRIVGLRLTAGEYGELEKNWKRSTIRKLSEYVRRLLFGQSFTVFTRDQSKDELLAEMALLRRELNAIGVNFNQAVHRLNMLDHSPQMREWVRRFEHDKERYFVAVESIQARLKMMSSAWLR